MPHAAHQGSHVLEESTQEECDQEDELSFIHSFHNCSFHSTMLCSLLQPQRLEKNTTMNITKSLPSWSLYSSQGERIYISAFFKN